jgi:hypothetical protein
MFVAVLGVVAAAILLFDRRFRHSEFASDP